MTRTERDRLLFDRIARGYAAKDLAEVSAVARRNQLLQALAPLLERRQSLGVVVEIGCGAGFFARYLQGRYERYYGFDHSPEMIRCAGELNGALPGAHFFAGDVGAPLAPRLAGERADLILCVGVLHHLSDIAATVAGLAAVARPGAAFVAVEPNNRNLLIQGARWLRQKLDRSYSREQTYFSAEQLRAQLAAAGLQAVEVRHEGFLATPFSQVVLRPAPLFLPLSRLAVGLDNLLLRRLPSGLQRYSWNLIAAARFPG
jgi:SAM-dependent methyltransferase